MAYLNTLVVLVFVFHVISNTPVPANGGSQVPCYFIFGDSLADNGNNNALPTTAKVNYPPYGIDFPGGPTGRFTNGLTIVDVIAQLLGINQTIPPFALATDHEIIKGVNYASGAAGIRDETGSGVGSRVSLSRQLENHRNIVSRLTSIIGNETASKSYLNKCLYTVGMGSNDYINNYFLPGTKTSCQFTPYQYAVELINQYSHQIKSLHDAGARKIALFGLGQIGCTPFEVASNGKNGSCSDNMNNAAQLFNCRLVSLVDELNKDLGDSKFTYINITGMSMIPDPSKLGFKFLNSQCCPVNEGGLCKPNSTPCTNRTEYAYFDGFHPTEAANKLNAARSYTAADPSDAYPFDISRLVQQ